MGGRRHDVPAHHRAASAVDEYVKVADIEEPKAVLFQSVDRAGERLTGRPLTRRVVLAMIKRRPAAAGLPPSTCCHTFRGDWDHGVLVERGNPRARAADRGARVTEDDEALRPDRGQGDRRRDRAYRDLNGCRSCRTAVGPRRCGTTAARWGGWGIRAGRLLGRSSRDAARVHRRRRSTSSTCAGWWTSPTTGRGRPDG